MPLVGQPVGHRADQRHPEPLSWSQVHWLDRPPEQRGQHGIAHQMPGDRRQPGGDPERFRDRAPRRQREDQGHPDQGQGSGNPSHQLTIPSPAGSTRRTGNRVTTPPVLHAPPLSVTRQCQGPTTSRRIARALHAGALEGKSVRRTQVLLPGCVTRDSAAIASGFPQDSVALCHGTIPSIARAASIADTAVPAFWGRLAPNGQGLTIRPVSRRYFPSVW